MAVTLDTPVSLDAGFGSTVTLSGVVVSSSNPYLAVIVMWGTDQTVSSVVFNGTQSLTRKGGAAGGGTNVDLWERIAPTSATGNVVVTMSGSTSSVVVGTALPFSGAHQSTPSGALQTEATTVAPQPSLGVTSATGDFVVDGITTDDSTITVGGGQTQRYQRAATLNGAVSTAPGAGSVTMTWSLDNFSTYAHLAFNVAAGGSTTTPKTFTGTDSLAGGELL